MKKRNFGMKVSMIIFVLNMLIQPTQAATVSTEKMYDSKIKAIQQLSNTYVVANYICDFNNDGIKDLLVSTCKSNDMEVVHNTIYTYKNNQMIKLNDELVINIGGRHDNYKLSIVSTSDGKQNLIKYSHDAANSGSVYEDVYFYKLGSNNKLVKNISRDYYSNTGEVGDNGVTRNNYYMNGKATTQKQYYSLTQKYVNSRELYAIAGESGNGLPIILAYADQYNKTSTKDFSGRKLCFQERNENKVSEGFREFIYDNQLRVTKANIDKLFNLSSKQLKELIPEGNNYHVRYDILPSDVLSGISFNTPNVLGVTSGMSKEQVRKKLGRPDIEETVSKGELTSYVSDAEEYYLMIYKILDEKYSIYINFEDNKVSTILAKISD